MKPVLTHPTWDQLHIGCSDLARQVVRSYEQKTEPALILGLVRGGMIPAVCMSHMLNDTPVEAIYYSAKSGNGDNKTAINDLLNLERLHHRHILIVDDIVDSGLSMREVAEYYILRGFEVSTAALYAKQGAAMEPDYVWQWIPEDSPWIIFPWEL